VAGHHRRRYPDGIGGIRGIEGVSLGLIHGAVRGIVARPDRHRRRGSELVGHEDDARQRGRCGGAFGGDAVHVANRQVDGDADTADQQRAGQCEQHDGLTALLLQAPQDAGRLVVSLMFVFHMSNGAAFMTA
jgi:hypothetical protein